ncbi:NRDE family protein [Geotalea sp. SG265]|uniref:NRDE family protein n=1 Tax=Geotalea sp. SG265 TaxID=2922867 RepID=UPI001FB03E1E|nr:NRDE family protein [Geotalea sp. SG265]
MCLILFAYEQHPAYRLILAANRDEYYHRPTAPAAFWHDAPELLAGRDLEHGGTWLGITKEGKIAAVSNYREPPRDHGPALSRGLIPTGFLSTETTVSDYLDSLRRKGSRFKGVNVLFGDMGGISYFSNRDGALNGEVSPGIHGLSNHLLDTPWPKVLRGRKALESVVAEGAAIDPEELFAILSDRTPAPDHLLPDTGIGLARERLLSSLFIAGADYGTRSSTVILIGYDNKIVFSERSFHEPSDKGHTETFSFDIRGKGR